MKLNLDKLSYCVLLRVLALILSIHLIEWSAHAQSLELEKTTVGETRVEVDLKDFTLSHKNQEVAAYFMPKTVNWQRNRDNLLTPRVLLKMAISPSLLSERTMIEHNNSTYFLSVSKNGVGVIDLPIDLFNPGVIKVFKGSDLVDEITIEASSEKKKKNKQLIDYSCSPYFLKIKGGENDYLSVGCKLERVGDMGQETPRLLVTLSSTNMIAFNGNQPPFKLILTDNSPVLIQFKNKKNETKNLSIEAILPKRVHRLKVAMGLGPYFSSSSKSNQQESGQVSGSLMFYGKFDLTQSSSLRFFNATVYPKTLFNNAGLYFSYDLAEILDGRIVLNTLLGLQGIHYKHNQDSKLSFDFLYPQGFEFTYKHLFNRENYHLTYGMFLSSGEKNYTNAWLRYGTSLFYEVNYISWENKSIKYHTWGLSVGFPIGKGY